MTHPATALPMSPARLHTELRRVDGLSRLFINGVAHPGIFCSTPPQTMQNFIDAGFDIFDTHPLTPHGWVGEDRYDYRQTDARLESYLRQKPDALLIVRFWLEYDQANPRPGYGLWWQEEHADQRVMTCRGADSGHLKNEPSFASVQWRQAAGEALRRVVAHVEDKYGQSVVAYVPGGGPCGEWFHWFCYGGRFGPDRLDDYSGPMRAAFHRYLRDKYLTVSALNDSWGTTYQTFDQADLPDATARNEARVGNLRDERQERRVTDFLDAFNRQTAETLIHFARMTKLGCDGRKVVMGFYGYQWHHQPHVCQARSGHIHLDEVLKCPDIDYVIAPIHYSFRQMGGVVSGQAPVATAIVRGKQYLHELDGSTNIKPCWPSPRDNNPQNAAETGQLQLRDLARTITQGASAWYMDLGPGMYDDPAVIAELRKTLAVARKHALSTGGNNHHVAVVLSPDDPFYYRENEPLLTPLVSMFKQFQLERMGLGYDDLLLADLERMSPEQTAQYRFWVFPSLVHLTDRQLDGLRRHCFRNGNHVLFNYAVGVCHGQGLNLERMREITGFDCGYTLDDGEVAVRVKPGTHELLAGIEREIVYGTYGDLSPQEIKHHAALNDYPERFDISPRFYIRGGGEILGETINYGPRQGKAPSEPVPASTGMPTPADETWSHDPARRRLGSAGHAPSGWQAGVSGGLAVVDRAQWVSVLSVAPLLPREILRNIAAAAGCHVYTDFPGQVFHCHGYFGMYFHASGTCRIRLPHAARVTDVIAETLVSHRTQELCLNAQANTTVLYKLEPGT